MDYFTRWAEAYAIQNQEATTVADKLVSNFFLRFSPPEQLHSDQGRQFESSLLHEVCRSLGIHKTRTTAYHPQGDGLVERFNRTLLNMLATTAEDHPATWETLLPKLCMAYNTSIQASTGYTPFYLMFGREARLPVDLMFGPSPTDTTSPNEYTAQLQLSLREAYRRVRTNLTTAHNRQKDYYDQRIHGRPIQPGDLVWLLSPAVPVGHSRKLHCPWTGPYEVLQKLSDCTYKIQSRDGKSRIHVVHFNRLKPCPPDMRLQDGDSPTQQNDHHFGYNLVIDTSDDETPAADDAPPQTRRYPSRTRRPPDRLIDSLSI